jgi:hypothetical protein
MLLECSIINYIGTQNESQKERERRERSYQIRTRPGIADSERNRQSLKERMLGLLERRKKRNGRRADIKTKLERQKEGDQSLLPAEASIDEMSGRPKQEGHRKRATRRKEESPKGRGEI